MQTPNFSKSEFLDDLTANAAANAVSGSIALGLGSIMIPGLLGPTAASYAISSLSVTATLPAPFGVLFSNGVLAQAHGLVTNADTQSYTVSFSGLLPVSGNLTAYLLASGVSIQQQPKQIIGPQAGHPDYNPSFVPYTAYQVNVDSLALYASSGAANNTTSFELGRFTLTSGTTTLAAINTNYQFRASTANLTPVTYVSGGTYNVLATQNSQSFYAASAVTFQLPAVSGLNGGGFEFIAASSGTTLQVSGSDLIYGSTSNPSSGLTILTIPQGQAVPLKGVPGAWYATSNAIGTLGGVLSGYLPNPGMAAGAAATNVGTLGGALSGTLPNPSLASGVAATNVGTLGGALSGTLPNPTIASSVSLPGSPTTTTQASGTNNTTVATTAFVKTAITNAVSGFLVAANNLSDVASASTARANLGLSSYTTAGYTPNLNTGFQEAHELGALPANFTINVLLECLTGQGGYSPGDVILNPIGGTGGATPAFTTFANGTYVGLSTSSAVYIAITNKGGGGAINITPADWEIYIVLEFNA